MSAKSELVFGSVIISGALVSAGDITIDVEAAFWSPYVAVAGRALERSCCCCCCICGQSPF